MPKLVSHINAACLWSLPDWSTAPKTLDEQLESLAELGVEAIQHPMPETLPDTPLDRVGMGRIDSTADAARLAQSHQDLGCLLTTVHVGSGFETDAEADKLIESILAASEQYQYPLFVETHRATVTQDMRRTLDLVKRFPELRFNADLSHWYTGQEMTYGDLFAKLDLLQPVFDRVRYLHGRIGTPCCAQVAIEGAHDQRDFVQHFREMWQRSAAGFMRTGSKHKELPFAPELLPYSIDYNGQQHNVFYAQQREGQEESDRWIQAQILQQIMQDCAQQVGLAY